VTHYKNLIVNVRDDVLWLRINRPQSKNALSGATLSELREACAAGAAIASLKAMVVTGEGSESFAAGGDLKEFAAIRSVEATDQLWETGSGALDGIRNFPVPVVAAVNGWALGGGAELAVACDYRVAARHAAIGFIHARLNITCGFGGGADLMRLLGHSRALRHALGAKALSAAEAHALGLVDEVAAEDEALEDCVTRFLEPMLRHKPQVIRAYKRMAVAQREGAPLQARRAIEKECFRDTWMHDDHWSAVDQMTRR